MIPLGAHDFPYIFHSQAQTLLNFPSTWTVQSHDGLGVFTLSTLWTWPYGALYGIGAKFGLDYSFLTLILGILPVFALGWYSLSKLKVNYVGKLLFVANTYILMLIDGGQLSLAVGYALLPLAIHFLDHPLQFSLTIAAISFLDIRYLYILLFPIGLKLFFDHKNLVQYLKSGVLSAFILLGLHAYWIVPAFMSRGPSLPSTYARPAQIDLLSFAKISHTSLLIHPHWPKNIFGQIPPISRQFILLPILAILPIFFRPKDKLILYWSTLAGVAIFLAKGGNPPFPQVYIWLFTHVPGFSLFRDPTKFYPLLALSYSVLISYSTEHIKKYTKFIRPALVAYLILLIAPISQATGLFSISRNCTDYQNLAGFVQKDKSLGGLVWVPSKPPLGFASPSHLSTDALTLLQKRPFAVGVVGGYEQLNFLRDATISGQLLSLANVKYIGISSLDPKRDSQKPEDTSYHEIFTNQLADLPWISSRQNFGSVTLLTTKSHNDLFFLPQKTLFVVGSDDIYRTNIELSKNALIFVEEKPDLLNRIMEYPHATVLLNNKSETDLASALIPKEHFLFPATQLGFSPDKSGWWKRETSDLISWRDFLQKKYNIDNQDFDFGGGWAISEGKKTIDFKLPKCSGKCVLLARVMSGEKSGQITFGSVGSVQTVKDSRSVTHTIAGFKATPAQHHKYSQSDFNWYEIGPVDATAPLTISSQGEINVINAIVTIPSVEWEKLKSDAKSLLLRPPQSASVLTRITYTKNSSTDYTIVVKNAQGPTTIAFSQNYDPLWRIGDHSSMPLYSFLNGFSVPGSGVYKVYFDAQKYVHPGLFVTIGTIGMIIVLTKIWKSRS